MLTYTAMKRAAASAITAAELGTGGIVEPLILGAWRFAIVRVLALTGAGA